MVIHGAVILAKMEKKLSKQLSNLEIVKVLYRDLELGLPEFLYICITNCHLVNYIITDSKSGVLTNTEMLVLSPIATTFQEKAQVKQLVLQTMAYSSCVVG